MKITIDIRKIYCYLLIYLMLLFNQSVFEQQYISLGIRVLIVLIFIGIAVLRPQYADRRTILFMAGMLMFLLIVRIIAGGIGLTSWFLWMSPIIITLITVKYASSEFTVTYIKLVVFLAAISVICFVMQIFSPELIKGVLFFHGNLGQTYTDYSYFQNYITQSVSHYQYNGLLLYVYNGSHPTRNCGIFTEPGVYQMVINSALYLILFKGNKIESKRKIRYCTILILTILTIQSVTGFIGALLVLFFYSIDKRNDDRKVRNYIMYAFTLLVIIMLVDLSMNSTNSIVYTLFVKKIVEIGGFGATDAVSSGGARTGMIATCFKLMLCNPLGIGYDGTQAYVSMAQTKFAGAAIMEFGAAMGVIPFLWLIIFYSKPILESALIKNIVKLLVILLIFNSLLAQSSVFYPTLLMLSYLVFFENHEGINDYD